MFLLYAFIGRGAMACFGHSLPLFEPILFASLRALAFIIALVVLVYSNDGHVDVAVWLERAL